MLFQRVNGRSGGRLINGRNHMHSGRAGMYGGIGSGSGSSAASASFSATLLSSLVPEVFTGSSTPTFTRATTAYVTDFEGLLKQVPSGCARLSGARFVRNMLGIASNNVAALTTFGGASTVTATTMEATGANAGRTVGAPAAVWAGTGRCRVKLTAISVAPSVQISCDGGTSYTSVTVTSTPQVFTASSSQATAVIGAFTIRLANIGDNITIEEMMVENTTGQSNTNPSEYVSVGVLSAPYHGAGVDGCKYFTTENGNTVASNVVTEATGAAISSATLLGYQAEGARTNLCLQSQTFDNGSWGKTSATVSANAIAAPDGTTTADEITFAAGSSQKYTQCAVVATGTELVASVYVKAGTLSLLQIAFSADTSRYANFNIGTGAVGNKGAGVDTASIEALPNGWYRISAHIAGTTSNTFFLSAISATTDLWVPTVATAGTVNLWGGQLEAAASASSYIPTTTVAVARNTDALTYVTASNLSGTTGTAYAEAGYLGLETINCLVGLGGAGGFVLFSTATNTVGVNDVATNTTTTGSGSLFTTATRKSASAWGGATKSVSKDGAAAASGAFDGDMNAPASFSVGNYVSGSYPLFGNIRNLSIWSTKKTDAELAALTA